MKYMKPSLTWLATVIILASVQLKSRKAFANSMVWFISTQKRKYVKCSSPPSRVICCIVLFQLESFQWSQWHQVGSEMLQMRGACWAGQWVSGEFQHNLTSARLATVFSLGDTDWFTPDHCRVGFLAREQIWDLALNQLVKFITHQSIVNSLHLWCLNYDREQEKNNFDWFWCIFIKITEMTLSKQLDTTQKDTNQE